MALSIVLRVCRDSRNKRANILGRVQYARMKFTETKPGKSTHQSYKLHLTEAMLKIRARDPPSPYPCGRLLLRRASAARHHRRRRLCRRCRGRIHPQHIQGRKESRRPLPLSRGGAGGSSSAPNARVPRLGFRGGGRSIARREGQPEARGGGRPSPRRV